MAPKIMVEIAGDSSKLIRELKKSQGSIHGLGRASGIAGLAIAGGLAAGGMAALNAAGDFERSLNVFGAVSGATAKEMEAVRKKAIQLGADVKLPATSAKDAADAMRELAKGGFTARQAMDSVRGTLVLSAAAGIENARAAEIQVNALNAFGLKARDSARVADMLANAANASSVEITDVADSLKMAAAVFSNFQGPVVGSKAALQDLTTAVALLGNAGIKGSDAGTSLKQSLLMLASPSNIAKDNMKALYLAAQDATASMGAWHEGMTGGTKARDKLIEDLSKSRKGMEMGGDIAYTATGKMRSFKDIIRLTGMATKNMTDEQRNYYVSQIFGADATRAVLVLMRAQNGEWEKMHKKVGKAGAAQAIAAARMKGFKGAIDAFKSSLDTLAITFGTPLLGAATKVMAVLSKMAGFMAGHTTTTKVLVGAVAALGAALLVTSLALKTYTFWTAPGAAGTTLLANASRLLAVSMMGIPLVAIAAGLIALGAALVVAYRHSETFRNIVNAAFDSVKTAAQAVANFVTVTIPAAFESVKAAGSALAEKFVAVWASISSTFMSGVQSIGSALAPLRPMLDGIVQMFRGVATSIQGVVRLVVAIFHGDWSAAWAAAKQIVHGAVEVIKGYLNAMIGYIRGLVGLARSAAVAVGKAILSGLVSALEKVASAMQAFAADLAGAIASVASAALGWAKHIGWNIVKGIAVGIATAPYDLGKAIYGKAKGAADAAGRLARGSGNWMFTIHEIGEPMAKGVIIGWNRGILPYAGNMISTIRTALATTQNATMPNWHAVGRAMGAALGDAAITSLSSLQSRLAMGLTAALDSAWRIAWGSFSANIDANIASVDASGLQVNIPGFAGGVRGFSGGLAVVGERGPELVRLPRGSDVIPAGRYAAASGGGDTYIVNAPNYVGTRQELMDVVVNGLARRSKRNGGLGFAT